MPLDFNQFKQAVGQLADCVAEALSAIEEKERADCVRQAKKDLEDGQLLVVVAGEFKQGKSSLINALLSAPGLVPVDVDIATSVVSIIRFGPKESFTVLLGEPTNPRKLPVSRAELRDFATEERNPGNRKKVQMVEITLPSPILRNGICLVDTPGIGGLYRSHSDLTHQFLPRADVVIYVSDSLQPLKSADLEFLRERVWPHCGNVLYVVTRKDKNPEFSQVVESNQTKLAGALERERSQIEILSVSTPLKLDHLQSGDPLDLEDSGYAELESALWDRVISKGGRLILERCLDDIADAIAPVIERIALELKALGNTEERERIEAELVSQQSALKRIAEANADWRVALADCMADLRRDLQTTVQQEMLDLQVEAEGMLHDPSLLTEPALIGNHLRFAVESLSARLEDELTERAKSVASEINARGDLGITISQESLPWNSETVRFRLSEFRVRECTGFERTAKVLQGGWGQAGMLVSGGALLAQIGIVFPPFLIIGLGAGLLALGMKNANESIDDQRRADLNKVIGKFFQESQVNVTSALQKGVTEVERAVRDNLSQKISDRRRAIDESLTSLKQQLKLSAEQAQSRVKVLHAQQARLAAFGTQLAEARGALAKIPPSPRPTEHQRRPAEVPVSPPSPIVTDPSFGGSPQQVDDAAPRHDVPQKVRRPNEEPAGPPSPDPSSSGPPHKVDDPASRQDVPQKVSLGNDFD